MRVKEENEKAGLKLNIQRTKIMVSSPITLWQIEIEVTDFMFLGCEELLSMSTAAMKLKDTCSLEE